jgi:hypothetical protein
MNNVRRIITCFVVLVSASLFFLTACKKEASLSTSQNSKKLSVYLTDDPCQYDSVLIDIRYVEVKVDTSKDHMDDDHFGDDDDNGDDDHEHHDGFGVWDTLSISPGIYNVMKLRNGVDTLLGTANIPAGAIRKIRITLGANNAVYIGGVSYPLNLLPGTNNFVYIRIHNEDVDDDDINHSRIWLDFDVCESIIQFNGQYYLRPGFRPFSSHEFGEIEGRVLPLDAHPFVKAYNNTDSATAIPEDEGEYKIRGLKEGTYNLLFKASNGYKDSLVSNVQVHKGVETKVPLVTLHQ